MFRNWSFRVKPVKDPDVAAEPIDYDAVARIVTKSVVTCITAYVGADTVRRVIVYTMSAKF